MTQMAIRALTGRAWVLPACALLVLSLAGCALETPAWSPQAGATGQAVEVVAATGQQAGAAAEPVAAPQEASAPLAFRGAVESLPANGAWAGTWQVSGHTVRVAPSTNVDQQAGPAEPGKQVEVEGWQQPDGTLSAGWVRVVTAAAGAARPATAGNSLAAAGAVTPTLPLPGSAPSKGSPSRWVTETVHPIEFRGIVDMLPGSAMTGTWQVNGHTVNVGAGTDLKLQLGAARQGAYVQVIGWLQPDGSVNAAKILVKKYQPGKGNQGAGKAPDAAETPETETTPEPGATPAVDTTPPAELTPPAAETEPEEDDDGGRNWDVRLHGQVEVVTDGPGTWTVDGRQVIVDAATWLKAKQALAAGSWVQIKGFLQPDGSIRATSIQWVHRTPDTRPVAQPAASATPQAVEQGKGKGKSAAYTPAPAKGKAPKLTAPPALAPQKPGKSQSPGTGKSGSAGQGHGNGNGSGTGNGQGNPTGNGQGKGHK